MKYKLQKRKSNPNQINVFLVDNYYVSYRNTISPIDDCYELSK